MKYVVLNALHPVPNVQNAILHAENLATDLVCHILVQQYDILSPKYHILVQQYDILSPKYHILVQQYDILSPRRRKPKSAYRQTKIQNLLLLTDHEYEEVDKEGFIS